MSKDHYATGHIAINNVKITPNLNDIIFEQQAILSPLISDPTDIENFYFDNSITSSFKAYVNINVNANISKYAIWEIEGVYKPSISNWIITSSFTGDLTGVNFTIFNDSGLGKIRYTNSNGNQTVTTIRFRATTTAPPGSTPLNAQSTLVNNTSGNYITNRLVYSNSANTIASSDIVYNSDIFTIGGNSRILAQNANTFVNFSNGGAITSMGDGSFANNLYIGNKIGIANTISI